jgi:hypothetical protein
VANHIIGVLYATMMYSKDSKNIMMAALKTFLATAEHEEAKLLYCLYYEQKELVPAAKPDTFDMSLDLAFDDAMLDNVEQQWKTIIEDDKAEEQATFMQFEDRQGMTDDDDADEIY